MNTVDREKLDTYQAWRRRRKTEDRWSLKKLEFGFALVVPTSLKNDPRFPALPYEVEAEERKILKVSESIGKWSESTTKRRKTEANKRVKDTYNLWDTGAALPYPPSLVLGLTGADIKFLQGVFELPTKMKYEEWLNVFLEINWRCTGKTQKEQARKIQAFLQKLNDDLRGIVTAPLFLMFAKAYLSNERKKEMDSDRDGTKVDVNKMLRWRGKLKESIDQLSDMVSEAKDYDPEKVSFRHGALMDRVGGWAKANGFQENLQDLNAVANESEKNLAIELPSIYEKMRPRTGPMQANYTGDEVKQAGSGIQAVLEKRRSKLGIDSRKFPPQKKALEGLALLGIRLTSDQIRTHNSRTK
jgi:hypothetical protein